MQEKVLNAFMEKIGDADQAQVTPIMAKLQEAVKEVGPAKPKIQMKKGGSDLSKLLFGG